MEAAPDRRDSYRLPLASGRANVLTTKGQNISMIDVSASGVALLVPPNAIDTLEEGETTVDLGETSFTARLDVVRADPTATSALRVAGRFRSLRESARQKLSKFLIHGFLDQNLLIRRLSDPSTPSLTWGDPNLIATILRIHAMRTAEPLSAYDKDGRVAFELRLVGILSEEDRRVLIADIATPIAPSQHGLEYTVVVPDRGSIHHFKCSIIGVAARLTWLTFPAEIKQSGFRNSVRARVERTLARVRFEDPSSGYVMRALSDVGARGFSCPLPTGVAHVPGHSLSHLRLVTPEGEVEARGVIRSVAPLRTGERYSCGVEISEFADATDERRWNHFVFHQTHPNITLDAEGAAETSWELLGASDYLSGWTRADHRKHITDAFAKDWFSMSERNGHILLLRNETRDIGTVAGNRIYPKTWMVHHLGIDRAERSPGKRQQFFDYSRELYSAIMYMVQHVASTKYFAIWVEQSKRWNEMLYGDFVRSYSDRDGSLLTTNVVYKFTTSKPQAPRVSSAEVIEATADEARAFASRMSGVLPAIEIDALGYSEQEIALEQFTEDCAASDYERGRTIYLARAGGRTVAGLIAENGGEGTNVFGLLNTCRIIGVDGEDGVSSEIKVALLETAIEHYRSAGKLQFIFLDDLEDAEGVVTKLGYERVSAGVRWIVKRDVVPGWLSYVEDIFRIQINRKDKHGHDKSRIEPDVRPFERERLQSSHPMRTAIGVD